MANLVIDIGNTSTKTGIFINDQLLHTEQYKSSDINLIVDLLSKYAINQVIFSTVKNDHEEWITGLKGKVPVTEFKPGTAIGITNHYRTPETLGKDRLSAVVGAHYLYPGKNNLVIDGGTCITYDWVDVSGNYFGGSISPGLSMRYKALNYYTAALPLVSSDDNFTADDGYDTLSAIKSGVQNGIKHELTGFIQTYKMRGENLNIVLCGGDGIFFDRLLKNSIFAPYIKNEPYLVLKGLNAALNNNND